MSGGSFNRQDFNLFIELFNWGITYHYGIGKWEYEQNMKEARKCGPFEDGRLNELLYDVFCLIHSADYYKAGDIGVKTFEEDKKVFKAKWLKIPNKATLKAIIDEAFYDTSQQLYKEFGIETYSMTEGDSE